MAALRKLKKLLHRPRRPRQPLPLGPPPALLERYHQYQRLLAAHSAILSLVADLQDKASGGMAFDMHYLRRVCDRLGRETEALVAALKAMSGDPYPGLEEARRRVAQSVAEELSVGLKITPVPLALSLAEVREDLFYGGKAENLGELIRLGLRVPAGFGISAYAQKLFFESADLEAFIRRAISHSHIRDLESLREAGEDIRQRVMAQELPAELHRAITDQLTRLTSDRLAVRSSPLQEDSQLSFAGQFETVLNVPREQVTERYKEVIASQFTPRSLYYCHTSGFSYRDLAMGVVVMEMVPAHTAGVIYTDDPRQGGATIINAVCGLGSLAVGGVVEPDIFRVEAGRLVDSHVGEKSRMHVTAPEGGIQDLEIPATRQGPSLTEAQVLTLAALSRTLKDHFGGPQDIEWALQEDGALFLLQARPLRVSRRRRGDHPPARISGAKILLGKGIVASRGVASGPVFHLQDAALKEVPRGVVLVTREALPAYAALIDRVLALVCETGNVASHLATVLREARLPAIFGAKGAAAALREGELVTVDSHHGRVYAGRVAELLRAPRSGDEVLQQGRALQVLERVLEYLAPLNLLDPRAEDFRPESCRTYHDLSRFVHEKAMQELFQTSVGLLLEDGARRLMISLPLDVYLIDLGGGLFPEAAGLSQVRPEQLHCRPLLAYWRGAAAVGRQDHRPADLDASVSKVQEKPNEKYFAVITDDYLNLSQRVGFHFDTVESFLGTPENSFISLTFYGGRARLNRRLRRVRFLSLVLKHLGYRVEDQEDSITAWAGGLEPAVLEQKLEALGRLMMVSRQLDLVMLSDDEADRRYQEFITGEYRRQRG